jgi:two-component system chemotaxis response regulator CheB
MIVDDSTVARAVLSRMIGTQKGFEIVATAGNAAEAIDALAGVQVDVVLLDLEMPGASGLEALPDILKAGAGAQVLIVSSLCEHGAAAAVKALALGAADTLPKPGSSNFAGSFAEVLADRLRKIARGSSSPRRTTRAAPPLDLRLRAMPDAPLGCLAIAASTGGLHALNDFLAALPERIGAPILVTQHLPALFMPFFARQLEACGRAAVVAGEGERLLPERIHIAPGDAHLTVERRGGGEPTVHLNRDPAESGCMPSADPMLASVAAAYGPAALGVTLSGMGRDGLAGARRVVDEGGAMLAQDKSTSAVWGMPRVVAEAGLASAVLAPAFLARRVAARTDARAW